MLKKISIILFFMLFLVLFLNAQNSDYQINEKYEKFYYNILNTNEKSASVSASGLFISPLVGLEFPLSEFSNTARPGIVYGVKLEFASGDIYPFIIGGLFHHQTNKGDEDYKTINRIDILETSINSFGLSVDFLLNKYIKSDFTIPFVMLEAKYFMIERNISPAIDTLGLATSETIIGVTGGIGFTLYIFDIYGTYTYAKNYSSFAIKTRIHFPLIKF